MFRLRAVALHPRRVAGTRNQAGHVSSPAAGVLCLAALGAATARGALASGQRKVLEERPCFEVVEISGRGLGAVATRAISPGELVAAEVPVVLVRLDSAWMERSLRRQFRGLPDSVRQAIWELHDAHAVDGAKSLQGLFESNSYSCGSNSNKAGLYVRLARFNHSCLPNCEHTWDPDAKRLQLRTSTSVKPGEELCTFYVELRRPAEDRVNELQECYGFRCTCPACTGTIGGSDVRRRRLFQLGRDIRTYASRDPAIALGFVRESLDLLDQEGMHWQALRMQECFFAYELCLSIGHAAEAAGWVNKAYEASLICNGPSHSDTEELLKLCDHA